MIAFLPAFWTSRFLPFWRVGANKGPKTAPSGFRRGFNALKRPLKRDGRIAAETSPSLQPSAPSLPA